MLLRCCCLSLSLSRCNKHIFQTEVSSTPALRLSFLCCFDGLRVSCFLLKKKCFLKGFPKNSFRGCIRSWLCHQLSDFETVELLAKLEQVPHNDLSSRLKDHNCDKWYQRKIDLV